MLFRRTARVRFAAAGAATCTPVLPPTTVTRVIEGVPAAT